MAFDKDNATQPIGTFKLPSDGQLINCNGGAMVSRNVIDENRVVQELQTLKIDENYRIDKGI